MSEDILPHTSEIKHLWGTVHMLATSGFFLSYLIELHLKLIHTTATLEGKNRITEFSTKYIIKNNLSSN